MNKKPVVNKKRQAEKKEMILMGFKTKKAYRKWQKKQRPCRKEIK